MTFSARRPWWKKKRWIAAGVLWLVVAYPLSVGPLWALLYRGWLPRSAFIPLYCYSRPYRAVRNWEGHPAADAAISYHRFWVPKRNAVARRPAGASLPPRRVLVPVGELPRVMPDPDAAGVPVDAVDLPPLPAL